MGETWVRPALAVVVVACGTGCGASESGRVEHAVHRYGDSTVTACDRIRQAGHSGIWLCRFRNGTRYCFTVSRDDSTDSDRADLVLGKSPCDGVSTLNQP
jgi:hypothetical protein